MLILHFTKSKLSFNFLWSKFVLLYPFILRKKIVIMGKNKCLTNCWICYGLGHDKLMKFS